MPDLGMFRRTGVYLRTPGGNVENIADQKPVVRWAALNVGEEVEGDPSRWDRQRTLYAEAGIKAFPWLHCRELDDVDSLVSVARKWGSPAIGLNIEDVENDFRQKGVTLADVAQRVSEWQGQIHMATLPWVQNEQGWSSLTRAIAALEVFADEQQKLFPGGAPEPEIVQQLVDHAFEEGLTKVTLMYKTKPPNLPEHYDFSLCHSLYTADDITPTPHAWAAWEHRGKEHPPMATKAKSSKASKGSKQSSSDPNWHKKHYPENPEPPSVPFPRSVFPPDSKEQKKTASAPGPDVLAYKRALARAQRWLPWNPSGWDDSYSDAFSHGTSANDVDVSGIAGFQRQMGLKPTGFIGEQTFEALRISLVPSKRGVRHVGQPLFDSVCIRLLEQAAEQFAKPPVGVEDVRAAIADFLQKAEANEANWHYSQKRPVKLDVDPSGPSITSDCSGIVIQAYRHAAKTTGLAVADPAKQNWLGWGNTDQHEDDHPRVTDGQYQVGDLAHYRGHVTICRKAGDASTAVWTSHGQESGPDPRTLHYRSDFRFVVRPRILEQGV
jgi:hypothetical protein